ncbi:MAG: RluA family pseudouridine synthase [Elusimicrobia bacterium]|nr:RluA family pseudouridine synthase [Elusimicrobiota bacterium]
MNETVRMRLDQYLAHHCPEHSRSYFQQLIKAGMVLVNGTSCRASHKVCFGDRILMQLRAFPAAVEPDSSIPFDVLYEDDDLLIINKQPGIIVHPAAGIKSGTIVNAFAAHQTGFSAGIPITKPCEIRPGIVHRLDKDTSGVLVIAKKERAHRLLSRQFAHRTVIKTYVAIVHGVPRTKETLIDLPIGRDPIRRKTMSVMATGKPARTSVYVKQNAGTHSLLTVRPLTGRTHQIRVHLAYIGHPVVGDMTYGRSQSQEKIGRIRVARQMLHAENIVFIHPTTRKRMTCSAPVPDDFSSTWSAIIKDR